MNFSAACPSCGAAIDIAEQAERVTCPFCSSHFELDQSGAAPIFRKTSPPPPPPDTYVPAASDIFTPGQTGAEAGPTLFSGGSPGDPFANLPEQPFDLKFYAQTAGRLVDRRLWYALAAAGAVIFCSTCACLLFILRALFGSQ